MLDKLLKYEFKAIGRVLLPIFGACLIASLLLGLSIRFIADVFPFINVIIVLIYTGIAMAVVVLSAVIIIQRFYKNLLGNEGYLTLTLPVTMGKHLLNKTIASSLWCFFGTVLGGLSIIIIFVPIDGIGAIMSSIRAIFDYVWGAYGIHTIVIIVEMIILTIVSMMATVTKIYAAIVAGHQFNNHRILWAVLFYLAFGMVEMIIAGIFGQLSVTIGGEDLIFGITYTGNPNNLIGESYKMLTAILGITAIQATIYYIITYKLLNRKVNLD